MFCKNCGNVIDDDATFCPKCGQAQTEQAAAAEVYIDPSERQRKLFRAMKQSWVLMALIFIGVIVISVSDGSFSLSGIFGAIIGAVIMGGLPSGIAHLLPKVKGLYDKIMSFFIIVPVVGFLIGFVMFWGFALCIMWYIGFVFTIMDSIRYFKVKGSDKES